MPRMSKELLDSTLDPQLCQAVACLRAGEPVAFPTDTVAGLGVAVDFAAGPDVLYRIKGRDARKPIAWLVSSPDDLARCGSDVPPFAFQLARDFWPGALTLVVKASAQVGRQWCSAQGTLGLRMPDHPDALALIRATGCPLATTSANPSGALAPGASADIDADVRAAAAFVVEGGQGSTGHASTVIDCTAKEARILREGDAKQESLVRETLLRGGYTLLKS